MSYDSLKAEIKRLKNLAINEKDPDERMNIYDSIASYGPMAREDLLEMAEAEKHADAKRYCISRIKVASETKA
jgi:hypothetical protein